MVLAPGEADGRRSRRRRPTRTPYAPIWRRLRRQATGLDAERPEAVAKRHALGRRTARENIDDLCDQGSFVEYGASRWPPSAARRWTT